MDLEIRNNHYVEYIDEVRSSEYRETFLEKDDIKSFEELFNKLGHELGLSHDEIEEIKKENNIDKVYNISI